MVWERQLDETMADQKPKKMNIVENKKVRSDNM